MNKIKYERFIKDIQRDKTAFIQRTGLQPNVVLVPNDLVIYELDGYRQSYFDTMFGYKMLSSNCKVATVAYIENVDFKGDKFIYYNGFWVLKTETLQKQKPLITVDKSNGEDYTAVTQSIYEDGVIKIIGAQLYDVEAWKKLRNQVLIKPPLGLEPKEIWRTKRLSDIMAAINRYSEASKPIPKEWVEELQELLTEQEESQ